MVFLPACLQYEVRSVAICSKNASDLMVNIIYLSPFSTRRIFSREQAKSECDWLVMTSVFVASQSSCFFSVRANKFAKWKTSFRFTLMHDYPRFVKYFSNRGVAHYIWCIRLCHRYSGNLFNPIIIQFCPQSGRRMLLVFKVFWFYFYLICSNCKPLT